MRITLALPTALAVLVGLAQPATAQVIPITVPVKVVISSRVTTLSTTVVATAPTTAHGGRTIAVSAPINGVQKRVGYACSDGAVVPVKITLPSWAYTLGRSTWMARDFGDNALTTLAVDARQASRFDRAQIEPAMPGYVTVNALLSHYKSSVGYWVPSQLSPVLLQAYSGTTWTTLATLTTDRAGMALGTVMGVPGAAQYRLARPDGAQVWGTTSASVMMVDAGPTFDY